MAFASIPFLRISGHISTLSRKIGNNDAEAIH
jgi:hypothetical protein